MKAKRAKLELFEENKKNKEDTTLNKSEFETDSSSEEELVFFLI